MQETADLPVLAARDHEERFAVPEELVHRHREAALRPAPTPFFGDFLQLLAQRGRDLALRKHDGSVTGAPQAMSGLAHLPDRPALEREPSGAVEGQELLACAENPNPPAASVRQAAEARQQRGELAGVTHRVSAHERRATEHGVGEERAAALREEVALVPP